MAARWRGIPVWFKHRWTQPAKWRSLMHVNDPFIFLITDVNHRKPDAAYSRRELLVCMRDHMCYGEEFHPSLSMAAFRLYTDLCIWSRCSCEATAWGRRLQDWLWVNSPHLCLCWVRELSGASNATGLSCMWCWLLYQSNNTKQWHVCKQRPRLKTRRTSSDFVFPCRSFFMLTAVIVNYQNDWRQL